CARRNWDRFSYFDYW
nr:immunoglobulin heavy chain junction region [Mus musculus]